MKKFHISDVLSVTTSRLVSTRHMEGLYDILGFMTGENLYTHQLPRASDQCSPVILLANPNLKDADVGLLDSLIEVLDTPAEAVKTWLLLQELKFGRLVEIKKLENHEPKEPISELQEMMTTNQGETPCQN